MSGPKRNPDKLNTIGVVVVGICGAVLVYVTIVALQAFYVNDTSELQTMMDYGGQDTTAKGRKADEMRNITEAGRNTPGPGQEATFRIPIDNAMKLVVDDAKKDPSHLIPALPPSTKPSIEPVFGRPKQAAPATPPPGGAAPEGGAAPAGATPPAGAGSAAAMPGAAPEVPTGAPGGPQPVAGAGGAASGTTTAPTPTNPGAPGGAKTDAKTAPGGAPTDVKTPKTDAKGAQPKGAQPKAPAQPKTQPKTDAKAPAQPKADAKAPAQPKNP